MLALICLRDLLYLEHKEGKNWTPCLNYLQHCKGNRHAMLTHHEGCSYHQQR